MESANTNLKSILSSSHKYSNSVSQSISLSNAKDHHIYISFIRDEENPKIAANYLKEFLESESIKSSFDVIKSKDISDLSIKSHDQYKEFFYKDDYNFGKANLRVNMGYNLGLIKDSKVFIAILSKNILMQPKNLLELLFAVQNQVPIVLIVLENDGYDISKVEDTLLNIEFALNIEISSKLKAQGVDLTDLAYHLSTVLLDMQSVLSINITSQSRREQQLWNIQSAITHSTFQKLNISMVQWLSLKERIISSHTVNSSENIMFLSFRSIVSIMKQFQQAIRCQDSESLGALCNKIHNLSGGSNVSTHDQCIRFFMVGLGGCKHVIDGLHSYLGTDDFITIGLLMRTLSDFAKDDESHGITLENIDLLFNILGKYALDSNIQIWGCYLIFLLTKNDNNKTFLLQKGIVNLIIQSMENHQEIFPIQNYCCGIFVNILDSIISFPFFAQRNIINVVVRTMGSFIEHIGIQELACVMLSNFFTIPSAQPYLLHFGAFEALIQSMRWHLDNKVIQLFGCHIIHKLFSNSELHKDLLMKRVAVSISDAMRNHPENHKIQNLGNVVLATIAQLTKSQMDFNNNQIKNSFLHGSLMIGAKSLKHKTTEAIISDVPQPPKKKQNLGQGATFNSLQNISQHDEVDIAALVIKDMNISSDDPNMQVKGCCFLATLVQEKSNCMNWNISGAIVAIVNAMNTYPDNIEVQESACKTLSYFCEQKETQFHLMENGVATPVIRAIKIHSSNIEIIRFGIRILTNLATVQENCVELKKLGTIDIIRQALKYLEQHRKSWDYTTQEWGQRALINLAY